MTWSEVNEIGVRFLRGFWLGCIRPIARLPAPSEAAWRMKGSNWFGGRNVGLMGEVADAAIAAGGRTFGVIPDFMVERELAHAETTELHVVRTMHERKALMAERADAFVALPGGFGTLDELFEI